MTWDNAMDPEDKSYTLPHKPEPVHPGDYEKRASIKYNKPRNIICQMLEPKTSNDDIKSNRKCYMRIAFAIYVLLINVAIVLCILTR